ncbi:MAG: hypothetical protein ACRESY_04290, partial [Steroidobacteraceae bacterium]
VGAAIHIGVGLSRVLRRVRLARPAAVALAGCLAAFALTGLLVHPDPLRMTSGVYRTGSATVPEGAVVDYLRDGKTATISLVEKDGRVTIATNGKPDAGIQMGPGEPSPDEVTMVMAAALPLSMQPHPLRVANIGFGSGLTTHTLLASERVQRLDSIEIEPFMVQAARQGYLARIHNVFEDPRSHIVIEDARTFFATSHQPYDLIVSEPSNPWVSGVATLFSDEFYDRITHYLTADGYFAQWMQLYETNTGIVASVVKALAPHFGAYALYNVDDVDMLIIATRSKTLRPPDEQLLQTRLMRSELERVAIQSVDDFQSREIGDNRTIGPLMHAFPDPANSDFYPYIDLNGPRLRYLRSNAIDLPALTVLPIPLFELLGGSEPSGPTREPAADSALFRDRLVGRALAVRSAVEGNGRFGMDPYTAGYLRTINMSRDHCADPAELADWQSAVRAISDETTSFLSAAELEGIWKMIAGSACYGALSVDSRSWIDLLAAVARRNVPDIDRLGSALLADDASTPDDDRAYLTTVTAAAWVRQGDLQRARTVLDRQWNTFGHSSRFEFALRELKALTQPRGR